MAKSYNANSIEVLDGLDAIRKRPDMYIGATTGKYSPGLYRILREVIDNSLDEYLGGFNNRLCVFYDSNSCICTVLDNGRGIPFATGVKLANPKLTVISLSGDGDTYGIGL